MKEWRLGGKLRCGSKLGTPMRCCEGMYPEVSTSADLGDGPTSVLEAGALSMIAIFKPLSETHHCMQS